MVHHPHTTGPTSDATLCQRRLDAGPARSAGTALSRRWANVAQPDINRIYRTVHGPVCPSPAQQRAAVGPPCRVDHIWSASRRFSKRQTWPDIEAKVAHRLRRWPSNHPAFVGLAGRRPWQAHPNMDNSTSKQSVRDNDTLLTHYHSDCQERTRLFAR